MYDKNQERSASMKPHRIAGVSAAFCLFFAATASHAQGSVTLYGIADVGIEYTNNTAAGGALVREASGNLNGSRWGLKGDESLGGGLKAIFDLEDGFNVNNGATLQSTKGLGANAATTSRLFGRQAWVGLSYKGQRLTLGRQYTLLFDQAIGFDPMGVSTLYSALTLDDAMAGRADNAIKYTGVFGSVTAAVMYSTRYDTGYGSEVPGAALTGRLYSGALTYAGGPFAASVSYEQRNSNTVSTNTATARRATAAATYVFGPVKGFAGFRFLGASNAFLPALPIAVGNGAATTTSGMYWLGAAYTVRPDLIVSAAGYYQDVHGTSADSWLGSLRGDYLLSKRTDVYAMAAYAHNKNGATLGVDGYGSVAPGHNQTGLVVGIRHKF